MWNSMAKTNVVKKIYLCVNLKHLIWTLTTLIFVLKIILNSNKAYKINIIIHEHKMVMSF